MFSSVFTKKFISELSLHVSQRCNINEVEVEKAILSFDYGFNECDSKENNSDEEKVYDLYDVYKEQEEHAPKPKKATPKRKAVPKKNVDVHKCEYVYQSGAKKGEACGKNARVEINGSWYCGTRKTDEDGEERFTLHARSTNLSLTKKSKSVAKSNPSEKGLTASKKRADEKTKALLEKVMPHEDIGQVMLRESMWGNYVHEPTGLIVDKATEKVIGVEGSEGKILPLKKEHISICIKNNWKIDEENIEETQEITIDETEEEWILE